MCNKVTAEKSYSQIMSMPLKDLQDFAAEQAFWPAESYRQILKDIEKNILKEQDFKQSCAYAYVSRQFSELQAKQAEQLHLQSLIPFHGLEVETEHELSLVDLLVQIIPNSSTEVALSLIENYLVKIQGIVAYNPKSLFQLGCPDFTLEIKEVLKTEIRLVKQK